MASSLEAVVCVVRRNPTLRRRVEFVDAGASGRTTDRPALHLLAKCRTAQSQIEVVVVHKIDRLARNVADTTMIRVLLRKAREAGHICRRERISSSESDRIRGSSLIRSRGPSSEKRSSSTPRPGSRSNVLHSTWLIAGCVRRTQVLSPIRICRASSATIPLSCRLSGSVPHCGRRNC